MKVKVFSKSGSVPARMGAVLLLLFSSLVPVTLAAQDSGGQEEPGADAPDGVVPLLLEGVWENAGRYVLFDSGYRTAGSAAIPGIVLRTFYQWYDDRAAESNEYSAEHPRDRNDATDARFAAEQVELRFTPLTDELFTQDAGLAVVQEDGDILYADGLPSGAWDMEVRYANRKLGGISTYHIPVAVIDDKLYLHFLVKVEDSDSVPVSPLINGTVLESGSLLDGYWRDYGQASGILVSPPVMAKELRCYYVAGENFYPLRYWETDMEYDPEAQAVLTDGEESFSVPKHLRIGETVYTCTLGRRTQIRNLQKESSFGKDYTLNSILVHKTATAEDGTSVNYTVRTTTICVFGEPYLTLTDGTRTLQEIVDEHNARKKPLPPPPFPAHGGVLDFDWDSLKIPPERWDRRALDMFR